ncbi:MAG: ribose 5-phosphate isomerase B [Candidatus Izemoplasmatales bacterium]|jgi:ribose 5-phosphate isomerase B|nr:ribose 5-phosphate isomerase B [Candidatus Izemoplasmatales bacterium]MDD3865705.1 ribose 5-phosphate isomerase B [Candidatus Izemoplasmatales bacterium]
MKIAIGADHAGYVFKNAIIELLETREIEVIDFGTRNLDSVDYPVYAFKVAECVRDHEADFGILICGTGVGMAIAANKVKGIRAGVCQSIFAAKAIREHNNANIICLGSRTNTLDEVIEFVTIFLDSEFSHGERHQKRIDLITDYEEGIK